MKKLLACFLVIVLSLTMLTACGNKQSEEPGEQQSSAPTQNPATETNVPATDISSMTPEEIYAFDAATGTITGFQPGITGVTEITIPDEISGQPVKIIGDTAFREKGLVSVVLPDTLQTIEEFAFRDNSLTELTFPDSLTSIGMESFSQNSITSIVIPDNLTDIGMGAFRKNMIVTVSLPDTIDVIRRNVFSYNKISELTIPPSVKVIESFSFSENEIEKLNLSEGLERIDGHAFENNNLTELTIPASVTLIGRNTEGTTPQRNYEKFVFAGNDLSKVTLLGNNTEINSFLMGENNYLRDAYNENGAGTYTGTQTGPWEKSSGN